VPESEAGDPTKWKPAAFSALVEQVRARGQTMGWTNNMNWLRLTYPFVFSRPHYSPAPDRTATSVCVCVLVCASAPDCGGGVSVAQRRHDLATRTMQQQSSPTAKGGGGGVLSHDAALEATSINIISIGKPRQLSASHQPAVGCVLRFLSLSLSLALALALARARSLPLSLSLSPAVY
jgi:hypothetical protein